MARFLSARYLIAASLLFAASPAGTGRRAPTPAARPPVDEQLKRLAEALDRAEERLLASQGSISFWEELRERHESVSAVACENLAAHAQAMASFAGNQRGKARAVTKNRLASRTVVPETASR